MKLDHIAYRVKDRLAAIEQHRQLGYIKVKDFTIDFEDGCKALCSVLVKPGDPEVFISEGTPGSIVARWVDARGGVGAVHHMAYQVASVEKTMDRLRARGIKFLSDKPLVCPGLVQVFTEPNPATGIIYEYIERHGENGFCEENVKDLMESTDDD